MVDKCNCQIAERCSIIGYLPAGFDCPYFIPMDAESTFEPTFSSLIRESEKIVPLKTSIKGGVLKVVIKKEGKKIPLEIDLKQEIGE